MNNNKIDIHSRENQKIIGDFVAREVLTCQSSLVDMLLEKQIVNYEDITNLYQYQCPECGHGESDISELETPAESEYLYKCNSCNKEYDDEPEQEAQEIYEWWLVSGWLLEKLESYGEPVLKTDYGDWWGRTGTGQAILLDSVIGSIAADLEILDGQKSAWNTQ